MTSNKAGGAFERFAEHTDRFEDGQTPPGTGKTENEE